MYPNHPKASFPYSDSYRAFFEDLKILFITVLLKIIVWGVLWALRLVKSKSKLYGSMIQWHYINIFIPQQRIRYVEPKNQPKSRLNLSFKILNPNCPCLASWGKYSRMQASKDSWNSQIVGFLVSVHVVISKWHDALSCWLRPWFEDIPHS